MFDVGFWELAIIGVVALLIVGPQRLPSVAYNIGLWIGKARSMLRDVKADISREVREHNVADIANLKRDIEDAGGQFKDAASQLNEAVGAKETADLRQQTVQKGATANRKKTKPANANPTVATSASTTKSPRPPKAVTNPPKAKQRSARKGYYLYQQFPKRYTTIHISSCRHCNGGRGRIPAANPDHIKWHGPFADLETARRQQGNIDGDKKECRCAARS